MHVPFYPTQQGGEQRTAADGGLAFRVSSYPVDMSSYLILADYTIDTAGVPCHVKPAGYHPTTIAQYALAHWNWYLQTKDEKHLDVFLAQAYWFVDHKVGICDEASGWPVSFPHRNVHSKGPWLSALVQGTSISVLVRAYELIGEEVFLEVARRAVRTFERDILDGGISTPFGEDGVFFEEVAVHPATHTFCGFIFALFGLYDYVAVTGDAQVERLIQRGITTIHRLFQEFDTGFWIRTDLLDRNLSSSSHFALQVELLEAFAKYSGCNHCLKLASRWRSYRNRWGSWLRYLIVSRCTSSFHALLDRIRHSLFPEPPSSPYLRVCVPIPSHPFTGGILTVLTGLNQVTTDVWQLEYLAQHIVPNPDALIIHRFGAIKTTPWQFPLVWLYVLAGFWKLVSLMRHGAGYRVILPQDGLYTSAFAALAAKLAGARVVCIDHATLTFLNSRTYRAERLAGLARHGRLRRLLHCLLFIWYWPSLHLLAKVSAQLVDHYLIPGIAGDGIEEVCQRLGIPQSRLTRFASMVDVDQFLTLDAASRAGLREKNNLAADAVVIAIICRLSPEKGLDTALESIGQTLPALSPDLRARVRVIIAGDGPLRQPIEEDINLRGLGQTCCLWGDISAKDVALLLAISDIFLYTSTRGGCFSMAVLEAMAAECAVIASTEPISNARLLAEGRGIAVPAGDVAQTSEALVRLVNDLKLCRQMGRQAKHYVAEHHSPTQFRRVLMRATYWSALDTFLKIGNEG